MKPKLNKTETEIMFVIIDFIKNKGYSPTYREIGDKVWLVAGSVQYYLRNLRSKGYIDFVDNRCRTIRLVKGE